MPTNLPSRTVLRRTLTALTAAAAVGAVTACTPLPAHLVAAEKDRPAAPGGRHDPPAALTHVPSPAVSVLANTAPGTLAAAFARQLFRSAPVVVVASSAGSVLPDAARAAVAAHAPLLVSAGTASAGTASAPVLTEIRRLHPRAILDIGLRPAALTARLPRVNVVTRPGQLPATAAPAPLRGVAVLIPSSPGETLTAVTATARVAGATVVAVAGHDPRADPAAIRALAKARPRAVVAIGPGFGPAGLLASRLAVAATGTQLPGGGQVLFPGHRLVALYGHPGTPGLGALGQQGLTASIARARQLAAEYRPLSRVPVIPAFEIIATVAQSRPGPDGTYSYVTPVSALLPWVRKATAAGLYVILDLQAGRANLLAQAEYYKSLLARPDVGLALDPEWTLQPGQLPLRQIGSVSAGEVNSVSRWLAALTARDHLPQKALVLHQFRLSMISGEQDLDTRNDDVAIVIHMDGQGTPGDKQQTWNAVTGAAPPGVFFGWKNFFVMDHPMFSPGETMAETPAPVMISYQ